MKWKETQEGATRTKNSFLIFPRVIDGETRWFERATWLQERQYHADMEGYTALVWVDMKWLD